MWRSGETGGGDEPDSAGKAEAGDFSGRHGPAAVGRRIRLSPARKKRVELVRG